MLIFVIIQAQKRVTSLEEDLENTQNETGLAQSQVLI